MMKDAGLTQQERALVALMRTWIVVFLAAATFFAAAPDLSLVLISRVAALALPGDVPPPATGGAFWLVLAVAYLVTLAYLCAVVQSDVVRNLPWTKGVLAAKFASAIGFAIAFALDKRHPAYLVGAVVDGLILLITWRFYTRAEQSRT